MTTVTLQVLDGVDRGRIFRNIPTPLTIGREEGNLLRLNDERVSRFHAKIQQDNGDIILTDLESTNGTRVNNHVVQIRRLRAGDKISVGKSTLLFGSNEEIAKRKSTMEGSAIDSSSAWAAQGQPTMHAPNVSVQIENDLDFELNLNDEVTMANGELFIGNKPLPPLPQKLTPAQAARIAEILDFLHRGMNSFTENILPNEDGTQVNFNFGEWQKILAVQMLLARYLRAIAEPDSFDA